MPSESFFLSSPMGELAVLVAAGPTVAATLCGMTRPGHADRRPVVAAAASLLVILLITAMAVKEG